MPTDLSDDFLVWMHARYDLATEAPCPTAVCKRCGAPVHYLTAHAVQVHGDAVSVLPSKSAPSEKWRTAYGSNPVTGTWPAVTVG